MQLIIDVLCIRMCLEAAVMPQHIVYRHTVIVDTRLQRCCYIDLPILTWRRYDRQPGVTIKPTPVLQRQYSSRFVASAAEHISPYCANIRKRQKVRNALKPAVT